MRVGLTGGIASGKSTVASFFRDRGVLVIDSDQVARDVVRAGTDGHAAVVAAFGSGILASDGELDRKLLRKLVFSDPEKRVQLESIIHPLVGREMLQQRPASPPGYLVFEIPLLIESGMDREVDRVLVVDCPETEQLRRLQARDGIDQQQAQSMLAAQLPRKNRLAAAHDVIVNDTETTALKAAVDYLHSQYQLLAN